MASIRSTAARDSIIAPSGGSGMLQPDSLLGRCSSRRAVSICAASSTSGSMIRRPAPAPVSARPGQRPKLGLQRAWLAKLERDAALGSAEQERRRLVGAEVERPHRHRRPARCRKIGRTAASCCAAVGQAAASRKASSVRSSPTPSAPASRPASTSRSVLALTSRRIRWPSAVTAAVIRDCASGGPPPLLPLDRRLRLPKRLLGRAI